MDHIFKRIKEIDALVIDINHGDKTKEHKLLTEIKNYIQSDDTQMLPSCLHIIIGLPNLTDCLKQLLRMISNKLGVKHINRNAFLYRRKFTVIKNLFDYCGADNYVEVLTNNNEWYNISYAEYFLLNHSKKFPLTSRQVITLLERGDGLVLNIYPEFMCFYTAKPYKARHNQIAQYIKSSFIQIYDDIIGIILSYILYEK